MPEGAVELARRRLAGASGEVGQHVHLALGQAKRLQLGCERLRDEVSRAAERLHNHFEIVTYVLVTINLPSSAAAQRATASSASDSRPVGPHPCLGLAHEQPQLGEHRGDRRSLPPERLDPLEPGKHCARLFHTHRG